MTLDQQLASRRVRPVAEPVRLRVWITIQVLVATCLFVAIAATNSLHAEISLVAPAVPPDSAAPAGMLFWVVFGLIGGQRARLRPGGAVLTFSMPFIVAGTMLGGPLAGGLMGLFSEFELREIRTQPWYGVLANHSMAMIAAICAALVGDPVRTLVANLLPGEAPAAFFVSVMVAALVFDTVNVLLVIPTLAFRNDLLLREAARSSDARFRATSLAEAILAWVMGATYLVLGWWAPIACAVLVLIVWQAHAEGEARTRDELTGLLNGAGLQPRLDVAVDTARAGRRSAAFLHLDLDKFKEVNDTHLYAAGNEVLIVTARRILTAVRALDSVARLHGDEFAILLEGVPDRNTAELVAQRIHDAVIMPIQLRSTSATVAVGLSIGGVLLERGNAVPPPDCVTLAESRMERAKLLGGGIIFEGEEDAAALAARIAAGPRRRTPTNPGSADVHA